MGRIDMRVTFQNILDSDLNHSKSNIVYPIQTIYEDAEYIFG